MRLLLYCCFTAALLLSRLSKRVKEVVDKMCLLLYCCFTAALLLLYCCFTAVKAIEASQRGS
jgi:hypothetical protein